jgi:peptide/nickel transport system substrate-binding protein/oligopeptide transport system substrate-binding protein
VDRLRARPPRPGALVETPVLAVVYIGLNCERTPWNRPEARRALNHGVDVGAILASVGGGLGRRAAGSVPAGLDGHDPDRAPYAFDPAAARRLLRAAGVEEGQSIEVWYRPNPATLEILEAVQADWTRLGLEVELVPRDWSALKAAIDQGSPDAFYLDWHADYPDAENFLFPLFHSSNVGGGGNRARYESARVDSILEAAQRQTDPARRAELYRQADGAVFEDAPWVYLWFPVQVLARGERVPGYRPPLLFNAERFEGLRLVPRDG